MVTIETLTLSGCDAPQSLIKVTSEGPDGPVCLNDQPFVLSIHPAESPALGALADALEALPPAEKLKEPSLAQSLALEQVLRAREVELLGHIIADWSIEGLAYSAANFASLLAQFPALYEPVQAQVLEAFDQSGN